MTSPGMSIRGWGENSCWISSIGKRGSKSCVVSGARVWGLSGGSMGSGSDGSTLTQAVGIWLSVSRNFEVSCMGSDHCNTALAYNDWDGIDRRALRSAPEGYGH